jgi:AraC-like DNA-binding protein
LRNSNSRISEIAFAVGFQSLSQFNRVFKELSGKSPSRYRERLSRR